MKVTMLGTFPPIKGISEYCIQLAGALAGRACHGEGCAKGAPCRSRVDVDFVSFSHIYPEALYPGGTKELNDPLAIPMAPRLRVRRPLQWFNPPGWAWTALRFPGQVLHVNWWTYFLAPVELSLLFGAKLRRIPVVMTVHNVLGHETNVLDRTLTRLAFSLCDRFIVHTEENRRQLETIFAIAPERIAVVPYGPLRFYDDAPLTRAEARAALGLADAERVVLCFGYIRDYKGLDVLLRAMPALLERVPDARLVVAGTCWKGEAGWRRYQAIIDELRLGERVTLRIGYVPSSRVKAYFRAADVCALPYRHFEAQSGPGNIALAFGTPMVVARTGGLPALVRDERAVVPPGDPDALARALADCLSDPARLARMSDDSRSLAAEYSWDRIAEKTIAVYEKLLRP